VLLSYFTPALIEAVTTLPVMAPHFHIPLQSGSDRVLRLMRRPYNVRMYRALVERLAGAIPDLGLGGDVIVGHPGEGDEDFAATRELVRALPFSYLHVFAYSDRKGTEAARRRHVPPPIRERSGGCARWAPARPPSAAGSVGCRRGGGVAARPAHRVVAGLTDNYVEVLFEGPTGLRRVVPLTITRFARPHPRAARRSAHERGPPAW
jgi:hypothetical protein